MLNVFSLILFISILYGFGLILLQCDFKDRCAYFILCLFSIPLFTVITPKIPLFKSIYEIYQYLSGSSTISVLFKYKSLFIILLLFCSFTCCYKLIKNILNDKKTMAMSSRVLSLSRSVGYCGICSILLFSSFFNYISLHLNEKISSYGFWHFYIDILTILLLTVSLTFLSYLFANIFIYFADIANFSKNSSYKYIFRQCFWYCYSHKNIYRKVQKDLHKHMKIRKIHRRLHVSENIIHSIKNGKIN